MGHSDKKKDLREVWYVGMEQSPLAHHRIQQQAVMNVTVTCLGMWLGNVERKNP